VDDVSFQADRGEAQADSRQSVVERGQSSRPDGGTITVLGRLDGDDVVIEVADTGPACGPKRARIFEAFYQGATPQGGWCAHRHRLSVVQEFVQAHGGTIEMVDGEFPGATSGCGCRPRPAEVV